LRPAAGAVQPRQADAHQREQRGAQLPVQRAQQARGEVEQPAQDGAHRTRPSTLPNDTACWPAAGATGCGERPRIQASITARAIGAAVLEPKPPCSTATATAMVGLSAGA